MSELAGEDTEGLGYDATASGLMGADAPPERPVTEMDEPARSRLVGRQRPRDGRTGGRRAKQRRPLRLRPVSEQVIVIMGASSGIGRATALAAAAQGAKVVVSARDEQGLASLVAEIEAGGGRAVAQAADVSDYDAVAAVAARAADVFGGLDTWVHAAAVALYSRFEETTPAEFRRVVEVNLLGQVHGALAALPHLRRRGQGALVHVSSIEARRSFPYHSAYAAAKHGIEGFLEALRVELRQEAAPISVTNVLPASINTPLFDKARTKLGVKPMPIPPIYQPETVAEVILHAAEHPVRDIVAGGAGQAYLLTQRLSPSLLDALLVRMGFSSQRTNEPKSEEAPDNLDAPLPDLATARGGLSSVVFEHSAYNWAKRHSPLRRLSSARPARPLVRDTYEPAGSR
ncbi:MAG TPA: SDR family oxidoreductase [Acidimicrobiales bacterium]|nr:SDR family oxidoreductase [Acidimicrobiales bacterium]